MPIHQEVTIKSAAAKVYKALTHAGEFSAVTGAPAEIENSAGGAFAGFDGQITGRNIELKDDELIVQAWRVAAWPEGVYSIVRFHLEPAGEDTKVTLDQGAYPQDAEEHLDGGWHKMYWEPLKAYCE